MRTRIRVPETDARAMLRTVKSGDVPCTPSSADSQVAKRRPSRSSSRSASAAAGMSSVPIASAIAARTVQQPFDSGAEGMAADMPRCPNASHVSPRQPLTPREVTLPALTSRLSPAQRSAAIALSRRRPATVLRIPLNQRRFHHERRFPTARRALRSLWFAFSSSLVLAAAPALAGEHDRDRSRRGVACADLINFTSEGGTTVTAATLVTSGTVVTPAGATFSNLPAFCRVQGVSKPSTDSNILFEAWLPASTWNGKFLSAGEGGYVGTIGYAAIALNLQKGYATVSTDTGHVASDTWWAVGHPEKAKDYLYRAKHLVTIATKGLIKTHYGMAASRNYFQSCSNGGRQALIEIQRYPDDFDGLIVGAPWNFQSHSNAGFVWDAQALSAPGAAIRPAQLP